MKQDIHIGCSGFYYRDWKTLFYPADVPQKKWLEYYATHFRTVEINSSFYRSPRESTVRKWHESVPGNFSFTLKGSRYITHVKKLLAPAEAIQNFYRLADLLYDKLACILWQLPPGLHQDLGRLEAFCATLEPAYQNVIEFRHQSWFCQEVYRLLSKYRVAFCILSAPDDLPEELVCTADFAYIRFHGKHDWYHHLYTEEEMKTWSKKIKSLPVGNVYTYFNNDYNANAIRNARQLMHHLQSG